MCSLNYSFNILNLCSYGLQGELATDHDVVDYIMNQPNVVPRINPRVLSTSRTYLDLSDTSEYTLGILNEYEYIIWILKGFEMMQYLFLILKA